MTAICRSTGTTTRLTTLAGWCLWVTVWGPIIAILLSFQSGIPYSFYIDYRRVVFVALLIQMCAALATAGTRSFRWAIGLAAFAAVQNPLWIVHFGVTWPWLLINAGTVVVSFMAIAHVHDAESRVARAGADATSTEPR